MIPKLTPEMKAALADRPGEAIEIRDEESNRSYLLIDRQAAQQAIERWIVRELRVAEADVDAGRVESWDVQKLMRELEHDAPAQDSG